MWADVPPQETMSDRSLWHRADETINAKGRVHPWKKLRSRSTGRAREVPHVKEAVGERARYLAGLFGQPQAQAGLSIRNGSRHRSLEKPEARRGAEGDASDSPCLHEPSADQVLLIAPRRRRQHGIQREGQELLDWARLGSTGRDDGENHLACESLQSRFTVPRRDRRCEPR